MTIASSNLCSVKHCFANSESTRCGQSRCPIFRNAEVAGPTFPAELVGIRADTLNRAGPDEAIDLSIYSRETALGHAY
jgi:hypothetical protein